MGEIRRVFGNIAGLECPELTELTHTRAMSEILNEILILMGKNEIPERKKNIPPLFSRAIKSYIHFMAESLAKTAFMCINEKNHLT